jgi:PTS system N-acetylglucosamine-specific IIC component
MGPGLAIEPTGDTVVAPADGTIGATFDSSHAVALVLSDGTELLIHVGIDTVEMKGDGFQTLVEKGQKVTAGTPLLRFDLAKIRAAGHPAVTPVIVGPPPLGGVFAAAQQPPTARHIALPM